MNTPSNVIDLQEERRHREKREREQREKYIAEIIAGVKEGMEQTYSPEENQREIEKNFILQLFGASLQKVTEVLRMLPETQDSHNIMIKILLIESVRYYSAMKIGGTDEIFDDLKSVSNSLKASDYIAEIRRRMIKHGLFSK